MTTTAPRRVQRPLVTSVLRREALGPDMVRLVLGGPDLRRFAPSQFCDSYVKLVFLDSGTDHSSLSDPLDLAEVRERLPRERWPRLRTYTVRAFDADAGELTLDLVTHGDGLAGSWALRARPGDPALVLGPGGEYSPSPAAGTHLLVGDESALPSIAVALERMPAGARGGAYVEVESPAHHYPLAQPAGMAVTWVHREGARVGERLVAALAAAVGDGTAVVDAGTHPFVHGEAGMVRELRGWLRERGVPREQTSVSGYWRAGADDEAWRAAKREFFAG